jgi:hypothetical protein
MFPIQTARFFPDVMCTGTISEGGMGPGTPAMTARGHGTAEHIQDGRWIVGTYAQDQWLLDGTFVLTWELHLVVGWDPTNDEYRATVADNYGHALVMRGRIEGDRFIIESLDDGPARLRMVWDASNPLDLTWRNETSIGGGTWALIEAYHMTPLG